ncbi:hypothetical protein, partial [Pantoea septica]
GTSIRLSRRRPSRLRRMRPIRRTPRWPGRR